MQEVRIKVESESLVEYQKRKKTLNKIKAFILVVFFIVYIPIVFLRFFRKSLNQLIPDTWFTNFSEAEIVFHLLRIPIDLFIFIMYLNLVKFFVERKKQKLEIELLRFTCFNTCIFILALILGVVGMYQSLVTLTFQLFAFYLPRPSLAYTEFKYIRDI